MCVFFVFIHFIQNIFTTLFYFFLFLCSLYSQFRNHKIFATFFLFFLYFPIFTLFTAFLQRYFYFSLLDAVVYLSPWRGEVRKMGWSIIALEGRKHGGVGGPLTHQEADVAPPTRGSGPAAAWWHNLDPYSHFFWFAAFSISSPVVWLSSFAPSYQISLKLHRQIWRSRKLQQIEALLRFSGSILL